MNALDTVKPHYERFAACVKEMKALGPEPKHEDVHRVMAPVIEALHNANFLIPLCGGTEDLIVPAAAALLAIHDLGQEEPK